MVTLGAILSLFFATYSAVMICVRNRFYKELHDEIIKVDEQVQMAEGLPS
jgi:hypothetical protein